MTRNFALLSCGLARCTHCGLKGGSRGGVFLLQSLRVGRLLALGIITVSLFLPALHPANAQDQPYPGAHQKSLVPENMLPGPIPFGSYDLQVGSFVYGTNRGGARHLNMAFLMNSLHSCLQREAEKAFEGEVDGRQPLVVQLDYELNVSVNRTYYLNALAYFPFMGALPLVPEWGVASVEVTASFDNDDQTQPFGEPIQVKVDLPYSIIWYSLYHKTQARRAFETVSRRAFEDLAALLSIRLGAFEEHKPLPTVDVTIDDGELLPSEEHSTTMQGFAVGGSAGAGWGDGGLHQVRLEPRGLQVISRDYMPPRAASRLPWYLAALGGVEFGPLFGGAKVASHVTDDWGNKTEVASGNASAEGFGISLYSPPRVTGFFFPPILGYLSQEIDIGRFRSDLRHVNTWDGNHIPAVITDPHTGEVMDPAAMETAYRLKLRSVHLGQAVGHSMVFGTGYVQLFTTVQVGLNVLEWRHSNITLFADRLKGSGFNFFDSGGFNWQMGMHFPRIHTALRASYVYQWYRKFDFPRNAEFLGRRWDPEVGHHVEEIMEVDSASLATSVFRLSMVVVF